MDTLLPAVYDRLRALANHYLSRERAGHVLQPTALVHEAFVRLNALEQVEWQGKTHFFATAATQMRRVLIDQARAEETRKRGGRPLRVTLQDASRTDDSDPVELLALDEALTALAQLSARQARVAEMRLFAGMTMREIGQGLGVSERTVKEDWRVARAWLADRLDSRV